MCASWFGKTWKMGKVILAAALFFTVITCELVVTPEEEAELSSEYLLRHAEVVDKYQQEAVSYTHLTLPTILLV